MNDVGEVGNLDDGLRELLGVLDKRLHVTNGDVALYHHDTANNSHKDVTNIANKAHQRHYNAGDKLRSPSCIIEPVIALVEFVNSIFFVSEGFHDLVARVHFLDMPVEFSQRTLLLAEVPLRASGYAHRDDEAQR